MSHSLRRMVPAVAVPCLLLAAAPALAAPPDRGNGSNDSPAYLSFAADATEVAAGSTVRLSWASLNTKHCFAYGDWDGKHPTDGAYVTGPLHSDGTFSLECKGTGTAALTTVRVRVIDATPGDTAPTDEGTLPEEETTTDAEAPTGDQLADTQPDASEPEPPPQEPEPAPAPTLAFDASATQVASGASATLSWTTSDADQCTASGGWSGTLPASGQQSVGPIESATGYTLTCSGPGGDVSGSVSIGVAAEPTVQLGAEQQAVPAGSTATLSWRSTDADTCTAGGGWSGERPRSGTETVGPIDGSTTFSLSCSGTGGSAVAMISVSISDTVSLNWQAPTQNTDGTALTDLSGYRIYYGLRSGAYTDSVLVGAAATTSHALQLESGEYYFAMTALDADGNESGYSNEVIKLVP